MSKRLWKAASEGDLQGVRDALKTSGVDINYKNTDLLHTTALMEASFHGHPEIAAVLLAVRGINVNLQCERKYSALHFASIFNHPRIVEMLLNHASIQVNLVDKYGYTSLLLACHNGNFEVAKMLLDRRDTNPNVQDNFGCTALMGACEKGHAEVVCLLLGHPNINVNLQRTRGQNQGISALMGAAREGQRAVVEVLLDFCPNTNAHLRDKDGNTAVDLAKTDEIATIILSRGTSGSSGTGSGSRSTAVVVGMPPNTSGPASRTDERYHPTLGYPHLNLVDNTLGRSTMQRLVNQDKSRYVDVYVAFVIPQTPLSALYTQSGAVFGQTLGGENARLIIQSKYYYVQVHSTVSCICQSSQLYTDPMNTTRSSQNDFTVQSLYSDTVVSAGNSGSDIMCFWKYGTPLKITRVSVQTTPNGAWDVANYNPPLEIAQQYDNRVVLALQGKVQDYHVDLLHNR